jgi:hypothetical protein
MNMAWRDADTIIIGAGAAGLAAAHELSANNHPCTIVEARDRLGGRIYTQRTAAFPIPVELGAEFIHGESTVLFDWLRESRSLAVDAARERWSLQDGRLRRAEAQLAEMKPASVDCRIQSPTSRLPSSWIDTNAHCRHACAQVPVPWSKASTQRTPRGSVRARSARNGVVPPLRTDLRFGLRTDTMPCYRRFGRDLSPTARPSGWGLSSVRSNGAKAGSRSMPYATVRAYASGRNAPSSRFRWVFCNCPIRHRARFVSRQR